MRMRYEILPETGSWLVSGVRRGTYIAEVSNGARNPSVTASL
jgi:hypothetical protein